jgi:hypothetical protein
MHGQSYLGYHDVGASRRRGLPFFLYPVMAVGMFIDR